MPKVGEIRKANKTGRKGTCKMIYVKCPDCSEARWVKLQGDKPQSTRCVSCNHAFQKQIGLRHYDDTDKSETIICSACGEEKPITEFYAKKRGKARRSKICKQCFKARMDEYNTPEMRFFCNMRARSKKKGLDFAVSADEFSEWFAEQPGDCYYCGATLVSGVKRCRQTATIDRLDSNKNYMLENIALCCFRCNAIKGEWLTEKQMLEIADKYFKDEDKTL